MPASSPFDALPIGVCSWSLQVRSVPELVERVRQLGIKHVQIACGDPNHASWIEGDAMPQAVAKTKLRLTGAMLGFAGEDYTTPQTIQQTGGFGPAHLRNARLDHLEWGLNRTRELGLRDLSFHAGFIPDPHSSDRRDFMATMAIVGDLAAKFDIIIGFETGQESADLLKQTLDELNHPNLRINFDPANMLLYDKGDPLRAIELLAPYIRRVHAKDAFRPTTPGQWGHEVQLGQGEVNIPEFVKTLWQTGYRGPLCIERESGSIEQRFQDIGEGIRVLRTAFKALADNE